MKRNKKTTNRSLPSATPKSTHNAEIKGVPPVGSFIHHPCLRISSFHRKHWAPPPMPLCRHGTLLSHRQVRRLRLVEEPACTLVAAAASLILQSLDRRVRGWRWRITTATAQRLRNAAAGICEVEPAVCVEASCAASLGALETLLDSCELDLEPAEDCQ